ncbi:MULTISPECIES: tautomerase family protein [Streptomyces]|uniref:Tautomerase family protein n=1 Tax=Streptomyces chilikensis TaxID=1194079 RepID=A0ABV3EZD4_9ACTN|nr:MULTISPECIES: tautomerase family protein [Streptomyces]MDH6224993.1 4-oxalocrotonate tautomerase [Streptomyces sp. MJP52]
MPHVIIKHFPKDLDEETRARLAARVSEAVQEAFGVRAGAVSIGLEPVEREDWDAEVYRPEIAGREDRLIQFPDY